MTLQRPGMLWTNDGLGGTLPEQVLRGRANFVHEYGYNPSMCWVNPQLLPSGNIWVELTRVVGDPDVDVEHFWFGTGSDLPQQSPPDA